MVTVLLWVVAVGVPCALVLRLSEVEARPKRATKADRPAGQRRSAPPRSRPEAVERPAPPEPPRPAPPEPPTERPPRPAAPPREARRQVSTAPPAQVMVHDPGLGLLRRIRSSMALVALVAVVGLMVAVSLGGLVTALAVALRSAVE